jgi:hypothetical protein
MLDEPKLKAAEVKSLCKDLVIIAEDRNVIAHNPVVTSAKGSYIVNLVNPGRSKTKKFTEDELEVLHKRARATLGKLIDLVQKSDNF